MTRPHGAYKQIDGRPGSREHRAMSDLATLRSELRGEFAEVRKRLDLILVGVLFHILLQIAIRVFLTISRSKPSCTSIRLGFRQWTAAAPPQRP
jgi:hypothetical protein